MTKEENRTVAVDEFDICLKAAAGNRNPSDAGIRIGGEKYMFVSFEEDVGCVQLSKRGGGGAALAKTYTAIVMATYGKDKATNVKGVF
jgi:hypothetical protein